MTRKNFYFGKRSEYRHNYLPFDYYDFWITAKENQNQRYKNKIRDYLHTPFDWDEDQGYFASESSLIGDRNDHINQSTQTTDRQKSNIKTNSNQNTKQSENNNIQNQHKSQISFSDEDPEQQSANANNNNNLKSNLKNKKKQNQQQDKSKKDSDENNQGAERQTKSVTSQVSINADRKQTPEMSRPSSVAPIIVAKPKRRNRSNSAKGSTRKARKENLFKNEFQKNYLNNATTSSNNISSFDKGLARSITNIAVQTPIGWNLRDYKTKSNTARSSKPNSPRSASVHIMRPHKPPFANYGWATKTKDLSIKPTHNALANKELADYQHDKDAIIELTLHKLKKDAASIANEYSLVESKVADHFLNGGRSDSRAWNSEYDEMYPDYTTSVYNKDIYLSQNPNRLSKSTLVNNNPEFRRGPRSAKAKIYY